MVVVDDVLASIQGEDGREFSVSRMDEQTLAGYHYDWALAEGWAPTKDSLEATMALDTDGFYRLTDNGGKTLSTISAVRYPLLMRAQLGFFIANPKGEGYGGMLWRIVVGRMQSEGYDLELDCFDKMIPVYEKLGFHQVGSDSVYCLKNRDDLVREGEVEDIDTDAESASEIVAYDQRVLAKFCNRDAFLAAWLMKGGTSVAVARDANDQVVGYGVMSTRMTKHKGEHGFRIGPLVADSDVAARQVLTTLCAKAIGGPVFVDVSHAHPSVVSLVESLGFGHAVTFTRMSTTPVAGEHPAVCYGLTSLAYSPI